MTRSSKNRSDEESISTAGLSGTGEELGFSSPNIRRYERIQAETKNMEEYREWSFPARAPAYGKNGRRDRRARERLRRRKQEEGQNGREWRNGTTTEALVPPTHTGESYQRFRSAEISEFSVPTLIATSTKVASTKGETLPKRNAAARQRQAAVTADRVRRFRRLTTTFEKIHAVNISDGDKEHAGPPRKLLHPDPCSIDDADAHVIL
ncbi:hypothetical protein B0H14DRAFT_3130995 [Mycena olivaceomarginata]|nr:hypothetical protein B0H14DRAFT_3130995 [Mycena olivaceomarginata]